MWVGAFEGDAIAIALLRAEARRPLTYTFAAHLVGAAGGHVGEVRIDRLVDDTFFAQVLVEVAGAGKPVDARPSDAIALALEVARRFVSAWTSCARLASRAPS